MIFAAVLRLDRQVHQLVVVAKPYAVIVGSFRFMCDDRNDRGKFTGANLSDVEIAYDRVAIAFHCSTNLVWKIGRKRCPVDQNTAGSPQ